MVDGSRGRQIEVMELIMSVLLLLLELDRKHLPQDLAERMEGWHNHNVSTLRSIPIRIRLLGGMANTAPTN